jgi:hypothetical protein
MGSFSSREVKSNYVSVTFEIEDWFIDCDEGDYFI